MFAGHVGAALAIGRAQRRINIGLFVGAALLLDAVLWVLVILGWESAGIPADFALTHQVDFEFPYSHGLLAGLVWAALASAAVLLWPGGAGRSRFLGAGLVGAAVFSHWLLDALVHVPELPLLGAASPKVGLDLWHNMPLALTVEGLIVALGLWLFVPGADLSRARKLGLVALCILIFIFTVVGMTMAPAPPSIGAMAVSSLVTVVVVCVIAGWLGQPAAHASSPVQRPQGNAR